MNTVTQLNHTPATKSRRHAQSKQPTVLTDIYRDDINIAVWQRDLPPGIKQTVDHFLTLNPTFQAAIPVDAANAQTTILKTLSTSNHYGVLAKSLAQLVEMFCTLFELKQAGLRLTVLEQAMCPKFHVDRVPSRLVTTYKGAGTEWLSHSVVDRTKLGAGSQGKSDEQSGLYQTANDIHQLAEGDVALLKGELWSGNEQAGLVHRSPSVPIGDRRLLLTLDFITA